MAWKKHLAFLSVIRSGETNSFASEYRGRMQRPEIKIDTVASVRKWRSRTISVGFLTGSEGARSQARLSFCELLGAG